MRLTTKYLQSDNYFADAISEDATEEERNKYNYSIIKKLGQLEDIEDELEIDLITLFKALTKDFVYIYHNEELTKCEQAPCLLCFDGDYCLEYHFDNDIEQVYLKDYGKTWALTKEELL